LGLKGFVVIVVAKFQYSVECFLPSLPADNTCGCLLFLYVLSLLFLLLTLILYPVYSAIGGSKHPMPFTELENWNCAISYGVGSTSPLSPSFIFSLELARSTQVCFIIVHIFQ
jgi:hypothetical protein